jgi:hypothetical protein
MSSTSQRGYLENNSLCRDHHRFEMHTIPQALKPCGKPVYGIVPTPFIKIREFQPSSGVVTG